MVFGGCVLVAFLNPYGLAGMRFLWDLHTRLQSGNAFARSIGELSSPFAMKGPIPLGIRWFELLLALSAVAVLTRLRRIAPFDLAVFALFAVLAATSLRNIGMFVVVSLPLLLSGVQQIADSRKRIRLSGRARRVPLVAALALAAAAAWTVASGGYYAHDGGGFDEFGYGPSAAVYPIRCVDKIEAEELRGPIYNYFNFGGYLTGRLWPRETVFVDGRLEVVGERFRWEHLAIQ